MMHQREHLCGEGQIAVFPSSRMSPLASGVGGVVLSSGLSL